MERIKAKCRERRGGEQVSRQRKEGIGREGRRLNENVGAQGMKRGICGFRRRVGKILSLPKGRPNHTDNNKGLVSKIYGAKEDCGNFEESVDRGGGGGGGGGGGKLRKGTETLSLPGPLMNTGKRGNTLTL